MPTPLNYMRTRPARIVGAYSFVPLHVTALLNDTVLGTATASGYHHDDALYLVTNWHVVSGRDPRNNKVLHSTGGVPNRLSVLLYNQSTKRIDWAPLIIPLYQENQPTWFEHPKHERAVDVVALPLGIPEGLTCRAVNRQNDDSFQLLPGQDVFVLGFPEGFSSGGHFPIWKRGSIATEPDVDLDKLPKMLIDTATRKGMSGAPVIAQVSGVWLPEGSFDSKEAVHGRAGQRFIGVYSSREGEDETKVQLGVVWKAAAIEEIVSSQKRGNNPHPNNEHLID